MVNKANDGRTCAANGRRIKSPRSSTNSSCPSDDATFELGAAREGICMDELNVSMFSKWNLDQRMIERDVLF